MLEAARFPTSPPARTISRSGTVLARNRRYGQRLVSTRVRTARFAAISLQGARYQCCDTHYRYAYAPVSLLSRRLAAHLTGTQMMRLATCRERALLIS